MQLGELSEKLSNSVVCMLVSRLGYANGYGIEFKIGFVFAKSFIYSRCLYK